MGKIVKLKTPLKLFCIEAKDLASGLEYFHRVTLNDAGKDYRVCQALFTRVQGIGALKIAARVTPRV